MHRHMKPTDNTTKTKTQADRCRDVGLSGEETPVGCVDGREVEKELSAEEDSG